MKDRIRELARWVLRDELRAQEETIRRTHDVTTWLAQERGVGTSSKFMVCHLLGIKVRESRPSDSYDFRRCVEVMHRMPWLRAELPRMRRVSPSWEWLVDNWADLDARSTPLVVMPGLSRMKVPFFSIEYPDRKVASHG